jgi:NAD(P)-dependent dehydrogenase (short-subunit alcohol dehydrogenase family)
VVIEAGQTAVVTGAASGIGFGLAQRLAERGCDVVMSDVEAAALDDAVAKLAGGEVDVTGVRCDVTDLDDVRALEAAARERSGQIDAVFLNAGIFAGLAPMWELDIADWKWTIDVDLYGVIHGITAFVPAMVERNAGHVNMTSSLAGVSSPPFNASYNAAKHGVVALAETLRAELDVFAPDVGVSVTCPGRVATRAQQSARNRPAELTPSESKAAFLDFSGPRSERHQQIIAAATGLSGPTSPEEQAYEAQFADPYVFGAEVLRQIDLGKLHVAPGRAVGRAARGRVDRLMDDLES